MSCLVHPTHLRCGRLVMGQMEFWLFANAGVLNAQGHGCIRSNASQTTSYTCLLSYVHTATLVYAALTKKAPVCCAGIPIRSTRLHLCYGQRESKIAPTVSCITSDGHRRPRFGALGQLANCPYQVGDIRRSLYDGNKCTATRCRGQVRPYVRKVCPGVC